MEDTPVKEDKPDVHIVNAGPDSHIFNPQMGSQYAQSVPMFVPSIAAGSQPFSMPVMMAPGTLVEQSPGPMQSNPMHMPTQVNMMPFEHNSVAASAVFQPHSRSEILDPINSANADGRRSIPTMSVPGNHQQGVRMPGMFPGMPTPSVTSFPNSVPVRPTRTNNMTSFTMQPSVISAMPRQNYAQPLHAGHNLSDVDEQDTDGYAPLVNIKVSGSAKIPKNYDPLRNPIETQYAHRTISVNKYNEEVESAMGVTEAADFNNINV